MDYTEEAQSTLRRMSGEHARDDRERLSWAVDDHAVAVMAAMRDREGPFGAQLAQAKAALLSAIDAYAAAGRLLPADARTERYPRWTNDGPVWMERQVTPWVPVEPAADGGLTDTSGHGEGKESAPLPSSPACTNPLPGGFRCRDDGCAFCAPYGEVTDGPR